MPQSVAAPQSARSPARSPARSARGLGGAGGLRLVPASPATQVSRESTVVDEKETFGILSGLAQSGTTSAPSGDSVSDIEAGEKSWIARMQDSVTPAPVLEATSNRSWCCDSMTLQDRLIAFGVCYILGNACSASAFRHLGEVFDGRPFAFALTYTLGNIVALSGTTFLWGPKAQIQGMIDPKRVVPAIGYLATIVLTLFSAVALQSAAITLAFMVAQFVIGSYYSLSYIPGGFWCVDKACGWCCSKTSCADPETDHGAI